MRHKQRLFNIALAQSVRLGRDMKIHHAADYSDLYILVDAETHTVHATSSNARVPNVCFELPTRISNHVRAWRWANQSLNIY